MADPFDPIQLEIMKSLLTAVAEEMGGALGRTAFSPNIKERRDFSCAVFDPAGQMVAQAAHIPVHLGAMPLSVAAALERFRRLDDRRYRGAERPLRRRLAPAGHHDGVAGVCSPRSS